jgi:hypothetical protein
MRLSLFGLALVLAVLWAAGALTVWEARSAADKLYASCSQMPNGGAFVLNTSNGRKEIGCSVRQKIGFAGD